MHFGNLQRAELIAALGGILLALSIVAASAYIPSANPNAVIDGAREAVTAWQVHSVVRWLLVLAAVAPLVLTYIVLRDHELSWPRGELTAVVGIFAFGLIVYHGILDRPGDPPGQISLGPGWYGMLVGAVLIAVGGTIRSSESERRRKPPGVL